MPEKYTSLGYIPLAYNEDNQDYDKWLEEQQGPLSTINLNNFMLQQMQQNYDLNNEFLGYLKDKLSFDKQKENNFMNKYLKPLSTGINMFTTLGNLFLGFKKILFFSSNSIIFPDFITIILSDNALTIFKSWLMNI